jgi:hypothetical protein
MDRLIIPMHGGETLYTYALRRDWVYLCMEERMGIPMYVGETDLFLLYIYILISLISYY